MSQDNQNASRCSMIFMDMFPKDIFFSLGDSKYLQTESLLSIECLFDGLIKQTQEMVPNYHGLSIQANVHLSFNSSTTICLPKQIYEKEKIIQFPVVVQDDDWMLPTEPNQLHQQCQILSPHAILGPQEILTSSQGTKPMISQFISINGNQEGFKKLECDQESETIPSDNLLISTPKEGSSQPNPKQKKGRKDDSNNAFKKPVTLLNKALSAFQTRKLNAVINQLESKYNINISLKDSKSSRYGFIQFLVILRHAFGTEFMFELFERFKVNLAQFAQKIKKQPQSQSNDLLQKLPSFYIKSYELFMNGLTKNAIEQLYVMTPKFKQSKYMCQGIQKVQQLENSLMNLEK